MTRADAYLAAFAGGALVLACSSGKDQLGLAEPFQVKFRDPQKIVHAAQFFQGELPQGPPGKDSGASAATDAAAAPPVVTGIQYYGPVFYQGEGDRAVEIDLSPSAASVGLRLADVGSGYWVVPAGTYNPPPLDQFVADTLLNFGLEIPSRYHDLLLVAFDQNGNPGPQRKESLCIANRVPDFFNSCQPTSRLPKAVISLTWDTNADLDLEVMTPDGVLVSPKNPFTIVPDGAARDPNSIPNIDRDSNASCRIDGIRAENLVWPSASAGPQGLYHLYVNMYSACGQPSARFRIEVYRAEPTADGGNYLKLHYAQGGELLDMSANGGSDIGLFVSDVNFQ